MLVYNRQYSQVVSCDKIGVNNLPVCDNWPHYVCTYTASLRGHFSGSGSRRNLQRSTDNGAWSSGGHCWCWHAGTLHQSSHCNSFEDWSSNGLQWLDSWAGHHDNSSSHDRQGDMTYSIKIHPITPQKRLFPLSHKNWHISYAMDNIPWLCNDSNNSLKCHEISGDFAMVSRQDNAIWNHWLSK